MKINATAFLMKLRSLVRGSDRAPHGPVPQRVMVSPGGSVIYLDNVEGCHDGTHRGYSFSGESATCMCGAINFRNPIRTRESQK